MPEITDSVREPVDPPAAAARIRDLTNAILDPAHPPCRLRPEVLALKDLLHTASGHATDSAQNLAQGETCGPAGLAISPAMAAKCAEDFARTVVFMRGAHDAIAEARTRNPQRAVHVLYAGCGPLAILCIPLMSVLPDGDAVFTLIDIHEISAAAARRSVETLGLSSKVRAVLCADAFDFAPDETAPVDVIILEAMQACLEKEPQVALTRHLLAQSPRAILMPGLVRISAALMLAPNFSGGSPVPPIELGTVFELCAKSVAAWSRLDDELPAGTVTFPSEIPHGFHPMLRTFIRTHGGHALGDYDSGLTIPRAFPCTAGSLAGSTIRFRYRCGERPGLVAEEC